jgi:succinate-semialdehyde dehydrogenase/glutarate-semialdehyde dehydrogenase
MKRDLPDGDRGLITYSPMGVIYGIRRWGYPAYQVIRYAILLPLVTVAY